MTKVQRVDVPIFDRAVVWITDCSAKEAELAFHNYKGRDSSMSFPSSADGGVAHCGGDVFMWVEDSSVASIVFHELTHVAFSLCQLTSMNEDEELIAYLMGWLKREVADKIFHGDQDDS